MIQIRKSSERGHFNHGWLDTYHSFSFGEYYDPAFMGFRSLRVINEDRVKGGAGFPRHGHDNMEILTVILDGALEHKDSVGNSAVIRPGEVQRMTAGRGIQHSEFNPLEDQETHLLQIWILPEERGLAPGYEQKDFRANWEREPLLLVASRDGRQGSVTIHQDVNLYMGRTGASPLKVPMNKGRSGWLQVSRGRVQVGEDLLQQGDGAAISGADMVEFKTVGGAGEFLFFDLA